MVKLYKYDQTYILVHLHFGKFTDQFLSYVCTKRFKRMSHSIVHA